MIKIITNSKNLAEKKYVTNYIFNEVLNIPYSYEVQESVNEIRIQSTSAKVVAISSQYFNLKNIISKDSIPQTCSILSSKYLKDDKLPIFYGTPQITEIDHKIEISFDVFGMIFFMLTRWEESILEKKDSHGRFPAKESFAYKNNFLHRPIVNELVELLRNVLNTHDCNIPRPNNYKVFMTHDIDHYYYPCTIKKLVGDIVKRRSIKSLINRLKYKKDSPYNTFEWLIKENDKRNLCSSFYFMGSDPSPINNNYKLKDKNIQRAKKYIKNSNHKIGIHPSYESLEKPDLIDQEKKRVEKDFDIKITEGRQHYLRFNPAKTWNDWNKSNLEIDSTLGYPEQFGFRCGTGDEYSTFDFINKKALKLKERPLTYMDSTGRYYLDLTTLEVFNEIEKLNEICKRYNTPITLNFHNSSFDEIEWPGYKELYTDILDLLSKN
jgi:hypothetical protein